MAKVEPFEKFAEQYEEWFERNSFAYESELSKGEFRRSTVWQKHSLFVTLVSISH